MSAENSHSKNRIGVQVEGIDFSKPLTDADLQILLQKLHQHSVIYLRAQAIESGQFVENAKRFGPLTVSYHDRWFVPGHKHLSMVSNILNESGEYIGNPDAGVFWHTDTAYTRTPYTYRFLNAMEVPEKDGKSLGNTWFASTADAYDALPSEMKLRVANLKALHSLSHQQDKKEATGNLRRGAIKESEKKAGIEAVHPLVRTHPESGRKALYMSEGHTASIVGLPKEESDELIGHLNGHITQPQFIYRHQWQVGDLLIWDNITTIHKAEFDYKLPQRRLMHCATVVGGAPV